MLKKLTQTILGLSLKNKNKNYNYKNTIYKDRYK